MANNAVIRSVEANIAPLSINAGTIFPDATSHVKNVKTQISEITQRIEELRPSLKDAIAATQALAPLNVGDKSFRGRNAAQVYVAHNLNTNDYVARGNFSVEGRPFRVTSPTSFNSVLAQMKQKKATVKKTLGDLAKVQTEMKGLEGKLATLRKNLNVSTMKLRRNVANYTAKQAKSMRAQSKLKPTTAVTTSMNTMAANSLLQAPKPKGFLSRMFGRKTRRNNH